MDISEADLSELLPLIEKERIRELFARVSVLNRGATDPALAPGPS
jgi:hypothetical protein